MLVNTCLHVKLAFADDGTPLGVKPLFVSPPGTLDHYCEICMVPGSATRADEIARMWADSFVADTSTAAKDFKRRNAKTDKLIAELNRLGGI